MKKTLLLTAISLLMAGLPEKAASQEVSSTQVNIDPGVKYQTTAGWGASLAFYEGWLTAHPNKAEIYDVIFKELSLDILRVRNAYGYDNSMITKVKEFNQAAQKSLGHPIDLMVTSWGPPDTLKSNKNVKNGGTLKYSVSNGKVNFSYAGFARWWNQSLDDYNKNGIYPTYISIQNEPDFKADWESCRLDPTEKITAQDTIAGYNKAFNAVYDTVMKRSVKPRFLGPETIGIGYNTVENYGNALDLKKLYGIAHHLYHGAVEDNPFTATNFSKVGKYHPEIPHFMTEYSRAEWFQVAGLIYKSLADENASAFLYWDLIWNSNGLVTLDNPWTAQSQWKYPKGYTRTKFFYVFKQFSAFIHPGWERVNTQLPAMAESMKTVAFLSAGLDSATLVAINTSESDNYGLKTAIMGYTIDEMLITRTSETENGNTIIIAAGDSLLIPPKSITTIAMKISQINTLAGLALPDGKLPNSCTLWPNPFREEATIRFTTEENGVFLLTVYDLQGRRLLIQPLGFFTPGEQRIPFSRRNLRAGTYLFRLENNGQETAIGKFTIAD